MELFRRIMLAEGVSLLVLLFLAVPLKYAFGQPAAVTIVGTAHGVLFVMFVIALGYTHVRHRWPISKTLTGLLASNIPFGTFWFERNHLRGNT